MTDTGVKSIMLYQSNDRTKDDTNFYKFVETFTGNVNSFDKAQKEMKFKSIDFTSESKELRLLYEDESTFNDGVSLDTSFPTVQKLK